MWFLGKRRRKVNLTKPDNLAERREAEQALRESAARQSEVVKQRGVVASVASSLAEVRKRNHFARGIKIAMGGDDK